MLYNFNVSFLFVFQLVLLQLIFIDQDKLDGIIFEGMYIFRSQLSYRITQSMKM